MAIANVSISTASFYSWITTTNQLVTAFNQLLIGSFNATGNVIISGPGGLTVNNSVLVDGTITANNFISNNINLLVEAVAAFTTANAGFGVANSALTIANSGYNNSNAAYGAANAAAGQATTGVSTAQGAFTTANAAFGAANSGTASASFTTANAAFGAANTGTTTAKGAFNSANTVGALANGAFITANAGFGVANTATITAGAAFAEANNSLQLNRANQTFSGGITVITFNLGVIPGGNTVYINPGFGPSQNLIANGAITIQAPSNDGGCIILIQNGTGANTLILNGFTVGASVGDSYVNTSGYYFLLSISRIAGISSYTLKALQ